MRNGPDRAARRGRVEAAEAAAGRSGAWVAAVEGTEVDG